ncbi:MAG: ATP-dependent helicase [Gammaproteobacteria bacterium]|nr:ATP-dependent helicase [Gammaproteobacteria bacterium]
MSAQTSLHALTDTQRKAVEWADGPLLVLAGPGSGKTQVLTCRVARLLEDSPDERFRILALTFTNKAAHEMRDRIEALVPKLGPRAESTTFHGFCAQMLRQHGAHLGVKSNFEIYSSTSDREAVLADALRGRSDRFASEDIRLLSHIDALKAHLIGPKEARQHVTERPGETAEQAERIALAYRLYEDELHRANALDFNSLILSAYELLRYPAITRFYQTVYRYWLIDEFQDTNSSQYALLRRMAGDRFRRLFAVADDDQTIYEWNGASVRRISAFVKDFGSEVLQLPETFRCPPGVVEAANRLVVYNVRRSKSKRPIKAANRADTAQFDIQCRVFANESAEASGIAGEIVALDASERETTAVLARSRALVEGVQRSLESRNVPTAMLARRDDFATPEMRWLLACLKQINRPLDRRNMGILVEAFRTLAAVGPDLEDLVARTATGQVNLLAAWFDAVRERPLAPPMGSAVEAVSRLASGKTNLSKALKSVLECFEADDADMHLRDDLSAWRRIGRELNQARGVLSLDQFLQEMELRSKAPEPPRGAVSLGTVHGTKGLEFDRVYLMGLAEEVFPSWHSVRKGDGSAAIEEERRSCFVAITRTRRRLTLSRARSYQGWKKAPSRFLSEMGLGDGDSVTGAGGGSSS